MSDNESNLPPEIDELLHTVHGLPQSRIEEIENVKLLHDLAMESRSDTSKSVRTRALVTLGRLRDPDTSEWVLRTVAKDQQENLAVRTTAVASLRYLSPDAAENILIDLLDSDEESIRTAAIANLGVVGQERALEVLNRIIDTTAGALGNPESFEDRMARRAAFAKALVTYRLQKEEYPRFDIQGTDRSELNRERAEVFLAQQVGKVENILQRTSEPLYGLSLRTDTALKLSTEGDEGPHMVILLNESIADNPVEELMDSPELFALILYYNEESDTYEPGIICFSSPADNGIQVTFCRSDGKAVYSGTGTVDEDALDLTLTDTGLVGTAPTRLHLRITQKGLSFVEGWTMPDRQVTRSPEPFTG
jgi:hypothetical protein